jgi:hypothetical protein
LDLWLVARMRDGHGRIDQDQWLDRPSCALIGYLPGHASNRINRQR